MSGISALPSFWNLVDGPEFAPLSSSLTTDVVVIGGGMTGLLTAYLIKQQGYNVIILEKGKIGKGETASTTAHLTYVTDYSLTELTKKFGEDHAVAVWDAGLAAIEKLHEIIHTEEIECDFQWVPGYYHASSQANQESFIEELKKETELANKHAFISGLLEKVPFFDLPGIVFHRQAKFHATKFVYGLAKALSRKGVLIFENSEVKEYGQGKDQWLLANGQRVKTKFIVTATHIPLQGDRSTISAAFFQTKLYPYTSYVLRAEIAKNIVEPAIFWDQGDPYNYLRIDQGTASDYVIFGGEDSKTGQEDSSEQSFVRLEKKLREILPIKSITHRWSGQVIETNDGLPYIGEVEEGQFLSTGYGGNGITFGTVAAMMASDFVSARKNPWRELFNLSRFNILAGGYDYLKENLDYPYYMAKRFLQRDAKSLSNDLKPGEGGIVLLDNKRLACCKDPQGNLHILQPECTHLGCLVRFNEAECTWDCPCHGSRFKADGEVIAGPAEEALRSFKINNQ